MSRLRFLTSCQPNGVHPYGEWFIENLGELLNEASTTQESLTPSMSD